MRPLHMNDAEAILQLYTSTKAKWHSVYPQRLEDYDDDILQIIMKELNGKFGEEAPHLILDRAPIIGRPDRYNLQDYVSRLRILFEENGLMKCPECVNRPKTRKYYQYFDFVRRFYAYGPMPRDTFYLMHIIMCYRESLVFLDFLTRLANELDPRILAGYDTSFLELLREAAKYGYGSSCRFDGKDIYVYKHPIFIFDWNDEYHCEDGPAITFHSEDESQIRKLYYWKGHETSERVISGNFTVEDILKETISSQKCIMSEKYGLTDFIIDAGLKVISSDKFGTLYDFTGANYNLVSVPAPDRTYNQVFRVPKKCLTARDAIAWTYGLTGKEFNPVIQT